VAPAGGLCHDGTIQNADVISTGSNCDCVSRTQSWSATGYRPWTCRSVNALSPSSPSWASSRVQASVAASSSLNRALTTDRCQPLMLADRVAGIPGSPKMGASSGVSASASSTVTASASSSSISASDTAST
jgi:hypothetical protein